jgi:hypothetical protein
VLAAIADLKARGIGVTLYPMAMMDVPAGNSLPNPYGGTGQGAYVWRGRITCHPAPGQPGSPDQTSTAAAQVATFVAAYRPMILHYAGLAAAAGGIDTLIIGSEMRGMTSVRGAGNSFPFVDALVTLAADVRAIVGPSTKLTYAADWSEYSGYQPPGEKFFHLDPLWASPDIDAVGIDNYMPLADWRDGQGHLDAALSMQRSRPAGTICPICWPTWRVGKAMTGTMPAMPTGWRRCGRRSAMARMASRGCSATRISATGGASGTTTDRAGCAAVRRRPGCRAVSRSG